MAHLSAMKRTASLTDVQLTAWHNTLGIFDTDILNAAVLELALTETRFPEVGDLYQLCREKAFKHRRWERPYSSHGQGEKDAARPGAAEIRAVAARFGLEVP
jgi:hypothetical protein